ncbi:MAG: LPS export ABC transporter periplasmic protein LptC [Muribaculaceae bacterium]|nr:LPS export ABC transporter periplasmic protein LptC [Muribaculaceae bacterium]
MQHRWAKIFALLCVALVCLPSAFVAGLAPADRNQPSVRPANRKRVIKPSIPLANRAEADKVFLEYADSLSFRANPMMPASEQYQVLTGNVRLRKGGMFMFCDSAYFYEHTNSVKAFGNVRMEQGDTLFVNADLLDYDGIDEEAVLFADPGKKVRLRNRDVTLTTDVFHYDMRNNVGYYDVGGELTDPKNKLTSWEGEYYPDTKDAYFRYDVQLTARQKNDVTRILSDSLDYNTNTHIAKLISPSQIINSDGVINTTRGDYNTNTGVADLYARSTVHTTRGNTLTGDTLFYDRKLGYGEAFGAMVLTDSARQSSLFGDYGYYNEVRDSAFVTGHALGKEYSKGDTLYLHGDTITAYLDLADSTHVTNAFHRVRFYRSDIQGLCDSLSITERDSILNLYRAPVIWSGKRQIFGNVIYVHLADSTVDWARLPQNGICGEHIDEDCYNQLSGKDMTAWFADSTIRRLYVDGNVQLITFPMESDSTYNKYAYLESSYMDAYFAADSVERIHFWPETTSKITPLYLAKRNSYFLPKFKWYTDLRPQVPGDVFVVSQEMIDLINSAEPIIQVEKKPNEPAAAGAEPQRKPSARRNNNPRRPHPDAPDRERVTPVADEAHGDELPAPVPEQEPDGEEVSDE